MATETPSGTIHLAAHAQARILAGHPWLYESDLASVEGTPQPGDVVDVRASHELYVGRGLYSPHSKIPVRLLTRRQEAVDEVFWQQRIQAAVVRRKRVVSGTTAYRLIHADGDGIPGLIVDRYGDVLVMQCLTIGINRRRALLADLLLSLTGATAVYLRNDSPAQAREGLTSERLFLQGIGPTAIDILEGPAQFVVDIAAGQKTGWFCDQRENRLAVAAISKGKDVLDAFCHTGGFGVQAAMAGARSVSGLDASRPAVEQARAHAALNQVSAICDFRIGDAAEALKKLGRSRKRFDVVILDPPAFAKRRSVRDAALGGYHRLNALALPLIRQGGTLVTCSCSYYVSDAELCAAVEAAARRARRCIEILERRGAGPDHPINPHVPESRYLTCLLVAVS